MKKFLIAIAATTTLCITAQASANEKNGYIELGIGKSSFEPETKTYSGTVSGYTYTNAKATLKYEDPTYYGFEIGVSKFLGSPLRVGIFYTTMDADFKSATGTGTLSDGTTTVDFSATVSAADARGIGVNFDNTIKLYGVNAYYDFNAGSAFKPFVGVGAGVADIQNVKDKEFAIGLHVGFNYDLTKEFYVGGRISAFRISGPTDLLGLQYEDVTVTNAGLQLGLRF